MEKITENKMAILLPRKRHMIMALDANGIPKYSDEAVMDNGVFLVRRSERAIDILTKKIQMVFS